MPSEVMQPRNRPFGISCDAAGDWFIANNTAIARLGADLEFKSLFPNLPENIHQLHHDAVTGLLWVMATSIDSLLCIDTGSGEIRRFCLLTDQWIARDAPGADTQHFNSIRWYADRCYVVAHKFGRSSALVRTYDRNMRRISLWQAGKESHGALEYNGQLLTLDSRGGNILGSGGLSVAVCEPHHYARGMVITGNHVAIVAVFDFGSQETRAIGDATLRAFDLRSGERITEVVLPGVGNIQDIQLWGVPT